MPTIALRFSAGRYHATPWGRHVNEGEVEWPPCPWRLLRALIAAGFAKLGWATLPTDVRALIENLADVSPSYRLPEGEVAHTRHYMPINDLDWRKKPKVLDAFVRLRATDDLLIHYPVALECAQQQLLEQLVALLGYLGRAESWVEGRLIDDFTPDRNWCQPVLAGHPPFEPGGDQVALLASVPVPTYAAWRAASIDRVLADVEAAAQREGKKPTKAQCEKAAAPYPPDLLACLMTDTADLQQHGWSQPPGSSLILYTRPPGTLTRRPPQPASRRPRRQTEKASLLALASDTRHGDVLPLFSRCLPQAEMIHQSLISHLAGDALLCPVLTGCDATGAPLTGHRHVHYLPLDLDQDGRLDHFIIHAPMGLDPCAQDAILRLRRTWTKGIDTDIVITCAGFGTLSQFAGQMHLRSGQSIPAMATARVWVSQTPFVPPRHLKARKHTLQDQVLAELESRNLPRPMEILVMEHDELIERGLLKFVRTRRKDKPQPPRPCAFGLRLIFAQNLSGPIALGYASHFGLGLFSAESGRGTP